jgi:hypothetical protein
MASGIDYGPAQDRPDKRISMLASPDPFIGNARDQDGHEGDFVTPNEQKDLRRGLHQRHIGLIALAGAIVCCFPHVPCIPLPTHKNSASYYEYGTDNERELVCFLG